MLKPTYTNNTLLRQEKRLKDMADKKFCGNVKTVNTQHGELIKISFGSADRVLLESMANEKGYTNLVMKKKKSGEGYYLEFDTWQPSKQPARPIDQEPSEDLPF